MTGGAKIDFMLNYGVKGLLVICVVAGLTGLVLLLLDLLKPKRRPRCEHCKQFRSIELGHGVCEVTGRVIRSGKRACDVPTRAARKKAQRVRTRQRDWHEYRTGSAEKAHAALEIISSIGAHYQMAQDKTSGIILISVMANRKEWKAITGCIAMMTRFLKASEPVPVAQRMNPQIDFHA